ncbi:hypothetical protein D1BOALGB6SA_6612 [Olavius sp. associated proteobacterium Delta 1]|nr:hypothetical protein D1BOALGB6SA_6612 [Olavius sp. associated proteobacterium Delta 1]
MLSNKNRWLCVFDLYEKLKTETPASFICTDIRVFNMTILKYFIILTGY